MTRSRFESQIRENLHNYPGEESAIDFNGASYTWAEVLAVVEAVEAVITEAGLGENERVGLMGRNKPTHFAALWGVFVSGCCASMVHAFQPPKALAADIATNRWPIILGAKRDWTPEVIQTANAAGVVGYILTEDAAQPLERVTQASQPGAGADRKSDDTALELLSSGTTGKPKHLPLSRKAVDEMIERTVELFELGGPAARTTQILTWPISSLGGPNGALPAAVLGQRLAIQEKFNATGMLEMIRRYKPQFLSLPPAGLGMLLQLQPSVDDFSSVKLLACGSAPLDPNVRRIITEEYGVTIGQYYGATEFAGIITDYPLENPELLAKKCGSVGRALSGIQIRVVSRESGEPLPPGETGLVEALVPRVSENFTRTNDLGYLDEDGFLYIVGRADDVILRGGFKINPDEVAALLREHPAVGDAAVIGIPDERLGMVPAAAIETRAMASAPTPDELETFLRKKLPAYKIPVRFAIVKELPRTENLKPRREGLRALFS